ncbi:MAG: zinc ABC transporter permease subunit ZnuB [Rhodospirillales bacterium]
MFDDFFLRALIGGLIIALIAAPLGCFVVWRRMAYFGDALAHSALLGIAIGLFLDVDTILSVATVGAVMALLLLLLRRRGRLANDTALGLLSHGALGLGLLALSFQEGLRLDLLGYLFGDVLAISHGQLWLLVGLAVVVAGVLALIWRPLLLSSVDAELAAAEGRSGNLAEVIFLMLLALVVAAAMKLVGVLLVTALLLLPAAAARGLARTPEGMVLLAAAFGVGAVVLGLESSLQWDTPSGPSIVVAALVLFVVAQSLPAAGRRLLSRRV